MNLFFGIWLLSVANILYAQEVTVDTNYGPVKGFINATEDGKNVNIFLGIPFAKPPINDLRFEKPQKPDKWTDPVEAVEFGKSCYPHDRSAVLNRYAFSEDCLYLNIMAPSEKGNESYAVMVWIHGGGYEAGGAANYGYENFVNNFIARDVIVVTIQYRLGFLGFLSSGNEVMPGNLGLWDQTAALEFVKENIAHFGGDPNRITIFGLSAGGGSTSALTLSPYSRNLFSNSIQMSGSVLAEWSSSELVPNASLELAAELKCPVTDFNAMKSCLKNKTIGDFFDAVNITGRTRESYKMIKFGPRVDFNFFPKDLEILIKEAPKKPTIIGVAEKEGILFTLFNVTSSLSNNFISPEDFENYGRENLVNYIKNNLAMKEDLKSQTDEVQTKIINFYANSNDTSPDSYKYWLQKYSQLFGDVCFVVSARKEAELKLQADWPLWLYITDYYNPTRYEENFPDKGATHGDEEIYMFRLLQSKYFVFDENDKKFQKALLDSLTNFAKQSDPSTDEFSWEKATKERPTRHLRYGPNPEMQDIMFDESYNFWKSLENYDYNIITGKTKEDISSGTSSITLLLLLGIICLLFLLS